MNEIINVYDRKELYTHNFYGFVTLLRHIGYFYVAADFSKFALGWFQLASMSELAIAI